MYIKISIEVSKTIMHIWLKLYIRRIFPSCELLREFEIEGVKEKRLDV